MSVQAKLNYLRISPRKVRLVADLVRGRSVDEAEKVLRFTVKGPADPLLKLLKSAIANAENNFGIKREGLYIAEIKVDGGPILKRFMPRARGSVSPIHKKTSHVSIVLKDKEGKEVERKGKRVRIKKVYQEEKPKEEVSKKEKPKEEKKQETVKSKPEAKKQMFRRKSI